MSVFSITPILSFSPGFGTGPSLAVSSSLVSDGATGAATFAPLLLALDAEPPSAPWPQAVTVSANAPTAKQRYLRTFSPLEWDVSCWVPLCERRGRVPMRARAGGDLDR